MIGEALVCFDSYSLMEGLGTARPADSRLSMHTGEKELPR